jgi:3-dehydroquinate synthase
VAWGLVRACELGLALGITPKDRAEAITALLRSSGYETAAPHPLMGDAETFLKALGRDKKKKGGRGAFVVPAAKGARMVAASADVPAAADADGMVITESLLKRIIG